MNRIYSLLLLFCLLSTGTLRAQSPHWQFDPYAWEYDMTAYITLSLNNQTVDNLNDYEIAAFSGAECRGMATLQTSEKDGQAITYAYLRIRSNQQSGETITFKAYNSVSNKEYDVEDYSLVFLQQEVIGLPSSLIVLSILDDCTISVESSDQNKGSVTGETTVKFGTEVTVTAISNEGYHFDSWTSEGEVVSTDATYTFGTAGDINLVAHFAPNQYAMTFVLDNGEENVVITQDYGTELTAPAAPTKTGFTFNGWSPEVPATVPASDQTFTAQWERNSYKLTWDVDGVKTESMVLYEAPITKPVDPEKIGYTFAGWTPEVATTMPAGDVTYTATWTAIEYSITYDLAEGTLAEGMTNPTSYTIESENITLVNPIREGYTFEGWIGTDLAEATQSVIIAKGSYGDRNYTATWTANQYTMTFVLDNGEEDVVKTQDFGSELTAPSDPSKTGFTFNGWSPEVPAIVPASDQTFTAQWERNSYKLTWDVDGVKTESMVLYEAPITKPVDPEKIGYTFAGWTPEVATTMPAGDVTYTATWTAIEYSITYDLAEGTLAEGMTNPTSYTIESENITLVNPIREGYTFEGWIGTDLAEATQSVIIAKGSYGDRNYTATWTANQYTMTFVLDNGEEDVVKTQDFGSELTAPSDPSKTGFTFNGWSPEVPAIVPASDQTFTAQWERNSYKLTWDVDGVKTESMVLYEAPITKPVDPEKIGYTFAGWTPEVATTMPAGDVTYTATWTAIEYSITYDLAGGTLAEGMTNPTSYTIESEDITLVNPAREGYTFEGWIGTDLTEPTIEVTIVKGSIGNRSYTATWTISTAISTIVNDSKRVNVYDLSGCLIRRNIPVSSLKKELPVGIYIVDGKKVKIAK